MNRLHYSTLRRSRRTALCSLGALAAILLLGGAGPARAAISEGFESVFGTSYGAHTSTGWYISNGLRGSTARNGSFAARFTSVATAYLEYQSTDAAGKDGGVGNISFWYREWATADASTFSVQYNVNGGGWNTIATVTPTTTTYTEYSYNLNNSADNIIVRIYKTGTGRVLIDDFAIADYAPSCTTYWTCLDNLGTPVYSYYLGDDLAYIFYYELNNNTAGWTSDYGIGTTTGGSGWTWRSADYDSNNGTNWKWKSKANEHRFTATGNWYYAGRFVNGSCTYYADVTWESNNGQALAAASYFTVNALPVPTSVTATKDGTYPSTRVDLGWTQGGGKNVLITHATATPSGTPSNGTGYSAGNTFGNQTVVSGSQGGTSLEVTGLIPGTTYYFSFYSENHSYYSAIATASSVTLDSPQARNTSGSASPGLPAGTIYLGDTAKVFTYESTATVEGNYGRTRLYLRAGNSDLTGGTAGNWTDYVNTAAKSGTSGVFNATGTWYWGFQMDYGSPYGDTFWYKASSASWANLAANGTSATLSFSVNAIVNPGSQNATRDAVNVTSEIDLTWAKNAVGNNVMVVRKTSAQSWTEPTQGTAYSAGNSIGSGVVVYNGSATAASATSLAADTVYDFKFYSVNNNYYSPGVTAQASTRATEPASAPTTLTFSPIGPTGMTINWAGVSTKVLVVLRASSDLSANPADDTGYTADANFGGSGSALGGGKVVYSGSSTSVAVTGLSAGTLYYVRIYNFNGTDGTANYLTSSYLSGSAPTCPPAPVATDATGIGSSGFNANWNTTASATSYRLDVSTNPTFGIAGVADDFTDGNFSSSPAWAGDTSSYGIETASTLPSGSASTDASYLGSAASVNYVALTTACTETNEWKFSLGSPNFNPSSANYFGVVLMSSATISGDISSASFNGYYLRIGVDSTADYIELWKSAGGTKTKIGDFSAAGSFSTGALQNGLNLRITRNSSGQFTLYYATGFTYAADPTNNGGSLTDNTYVSSSYFGVYGRFADASTSRRVYFDNFQTPTLDDYVSGWKDVNVGNVLTYAVSGLDAETTYYYRVRAVNASCTSENSNTKTALTVASVPTVALANNDAGQTGAGNVAAGTSSRVLHTFKLTIGTAQTTLTALQITTAGHDADDLTNLKLWYSTDNTFGSDTTIGTLSSPGTAGTKNITGMTKDLAVGVHYFFVTADIASGATAGNSASVGAIASPAITVTSGDKSGGPTTAGGAQTFTSAVTISNTGTPAGGNIAAGTANAVLFGFQLSPATGSIDFSGVTLTKAGDATSSDYSNFEVVYDANGNGAYDSGTESVVSDTKAIGATIVFAISGQTGISAARKYLVIADASATATAGRTFTGSIASDAHVTTTGTESGTAAGNQQVISVGVAISNTGTPAVGSVAAGTANAVLFGFQLVISGTVDFTGVTLTKAGDATSSDLSNFEVVYDANGNGAYDSGTESVVSDTKAIGATIAFAMSGQTGITGTRKYLVIADASATATAGRTFTGSIAANTDVATSGTESGTAAGNQQTISVGVAISNTGTPAVGNVTPGTSDKVLFGFQLVISGTVDFSALTLTVAGTATSSDYSNFQVIYDADGDGVYDGGESIVSDTKAIGSTIAFTMSGQTGITGTRKYLVIADAASAALAGATFTGSIAAAGDVTSTGTESGTAAGNQQTLTGAVTIDNTGTPAAGNISGGATDAVLFGFRLSPSSGSVDFTGLSLTTAGTATSADYFNFEVVYDADNSGTYNTGDSIVSSGAQTLANPTVFTITGQTRISAARRYLVIADVQAGATSGRTFTGSIANSTDVTTSGTESGTAAGNQMTLSISCVPDKVTLAQRVANYTTWSSQGGSWDYSTDMLGMWAHDDNTGLPRQTVAWRIFKTDGTAAYGTGTTRELQPGDRFKVSVEGWSPWGYLGASLNDGAATGSWANRQSYTRGYIEATQNGDMAAFYNGGSTTLGAKPWNNSTVTLVFDILSTREFTAKIDGAGTPKYDVPMLNSPSDTDRIDGFSLYYHDDFADGARRDAHWKQETSVDNLGYVEFGADGGTRTIYGKITDGNNPKCPDTPSPNYLKKSGAGTITLNNPDSTYTLYTDIADGTLSISADGCLGTAPAGASPQHIRLAGGKALMFTDSFTLNANRGITLVGNNPYLVISDNKVVTYNGIITDGSSTCGLIKNQGGELILGGASTYKGTTYIDNGTLTLNNAAALGTGPINLGQGSGTPNYPATLKLALAGMTLANTPITIKDNSSGIKTIQAAENATISSAISIDEQSDDQFSVDVANGKTLTLNGVMSGDVGGGKITKTGAGTLVLSNAGNSHDKKIQINEGTVSISASRNLGKDPSTAYANKITLNGGILKATASFELNQYYSTTLGAGNGFIEVDPTYTLTYPAPISGSGAFAKTGTGILKLTGANTLSGPVTNSAGTLQIGDNGTAGSLTAGITNNAALIWHRSDDVSYGGIIAGTGTLEKKGAGTLSLSGASSYTGATTLSEGVLRISNAGALGTTAGNTTVASGAALELNSHMMTITDALVLNGSGPAGKGALTNNAGLQATVSGAITLNSATTIGVQGILNLNGGLSGAQALTLAVGGTCNINSVIGNVASISKTDSGTLDLKSGYTHTFSGTATVSAGTLIHNATANSMAVSVGASGTLVGAGSLAGLGVYGAVYPGATAAAIGALSVSSLTTYNNAALYFQIGDCSNTANRDYISNSGTATIGATTKVYIDDDVLSNFNNASTYSWNLIVGGITSAANFALDETLWGTAKDGGTFALSASGNNLVLTFTPRPLDPPAAFTATATSASTISLAFTRNAYPDNVIIVYNTTGYGDFTTPSGAAPDVGQAFAGGTVVYKGPTSPVVHQDLASCTRYYYKAWSYSGSRYSSTGLTADDTTDDPAAPTGLDADPIGDDSFTATWSAAAGAASYEIDVSLYENFQTPGGGTIGVQDFETTPATPTATFSASGGGYITGSSASGDSPASSPFYSGGARAYSVANSTATLTFDAINTSTFGSPQLTMRLAAFSVNGSANGVDGTDIVTVEVSPDNGSTWYSTVRVLGNTNAKWSYAGGTGNASTAYDGNSSPVDFAPGGGGLRTTDGYSTITITGLPTVSQMRVRVTMVNNDANERWCIDDLSITGTGTPVPSFLTGYEDKPVSGTSQEVTGLTPGVTYYFRVRSVGAGSCTSANSTTKAVTTLIYSAVTLADNGTQIGIGTALAGATSHVLYSFKLTTATAPATLTAVAVNTTGNYGASDVANLKLWYSTDSTFSSSSDSPIGTLDNPGVAGEKTFSGLSQVIALGATGYFFVTTAIAESPECGKNIGLAAIETDDLTFTAATKSGSTTAGGAQTISVGEPTTHAADLVFSTLGAEQMDLTWTSGDGARRIVVATAYDMAGLWLFDEGSGTTAYDSTINANHGTLYNTPTWTTRTGGAGALNFLRTSTEYVEVPNSSSLQTTNSQTISIWLRPTDFAVRQNPWNKAYGGEGSITLEPAQHLNYYFGAYGGDGGTYDYAPSSSTLTAGEWKHLVVVRDLDADKMRWYFNGALVNEVNIVNNPNYAKASTANLLFGNGYAGALNGDISEPMLIDYALTATQVAKLYAMGSLATGWVPTDGTAPGGVDSDFSQATDQGFNSRIVYDGTGSGFTLTGLEAYTPYRLTVYEYNGSGACVNYLTSGTPESEVLTTACPEPPVVQSASEVSGTGFQANWSAAAGAEGYRIDVSTSPEFSTGGSPATDLFISEYIEGSGNNKAIEIFNGTGAAVDLADYKLRVYYNGNVTYTSISLSGTLADGEVYVVANSSANAAILAQADKTSADLAHNGNDVVALAKSGSNIDVLGTIGSSANFALDVTKVRKGTVGAGTTTYATGEWDNSAIDTTTYLGSHTYTGAGTPSFVAGYGDADAGSGTSFTVSGLSPNTTYYYRLRSTKASCESGNSEVMEVLTLVAEPTEQAYNIAFNDVDYNSMTVSWSGGNGANSLVIARADEAPSSGPEDGTAYAASANFGGGLGDPLGGGRVVYIGNGSSFSLTGLSEGTTYYLQVFEFNGSAGQENYLTSTATLNPNSQATLAPPPLPTFEADVETPEFVRLKGLPGSGTEKLIVLRADSEPTAGPANGTAASSYPKGTSLGGGTIIYNDNGNSSDFLNYVVPAGSTHYFYAYSAEATGNLYSRPVIRVVTTPTYDSGYAVESFSYTNNLSFNTSQSSSYTVGNTGTGWASDWTGVWGNLTDWFVHSGSFGTQANYPQPGANKIRRYGVGNSTYKIRRDLSTVYTTGQLFFSFIMNYEYQGANRWCGIEFLDYGNPKFFVGKESGTPWFRLTAGGSTDGGNLYGNNQAGSPYDYIIMGIYNFANGYVGATAYRIGTDTVPISQPGSWNANGNWGTGYYINGINLVVGSSNSADSCGTVYWDEIRVAGSWEGLVKGDANVPQIPPAPLLANPVSGTAEHLLIQIGDDYLEPVSGHGTTNVLYTVNDDIFVAGIGSKPGTLLNAGFNDPISPPWTKTADSRNTSGKNIAYYDATVGLMVGANGVPLGSTLSPGGLRFDAWETDAGGNDSNDNTGPFGEYLQDVACGPTRTVTFSANMMQNEAFTTGFFGLLMQFWNEDKTTLLGAKSSAGQPGVNTDVKRVSITETSPAGTAWVRVFVQMFSPPGPNTDASILQNGDFAQGATYWSCGDAAAESGKLKFEFEHNPLNGFARQDVAVSVNQTLSFSADLWTDNKTHDPPEFFGLRLVFLDSGGTEMGSTAQEVEYDWSGGSRNLAINNVEVPTGAAKVRCEIKSTGSSAQTANDGYADNAILTVAGEEGTGGENRFGYVDSCQLEGAGVSGSGDATDLTITLAGYNPVYGLARGDDDAATQCNLDLTNTLFQLAHNDVNHYAGDPPSTPFADTIYPWATNIWFWENMGGSEFYALQQANYQPFHHPNQTGGQAGDQGDAVTNRITLSLLSAGAVNREALTNQQYGLFAIMDDDPDPPVASWVYAGPDWPAALAAGVGINNPSVKVTDGDLYALSISAGSLDIAYAWEDESGVFAANANAATESLQYFTSDHKAANVCPNFDLTNTQYVVDYVNTIHNAAHIYGENGANIITCFWENVEIPDITKQNIVLYSEDPDTASWSLTVSAQDTDNDRGSHPNYMDASKTDPNVSLDRAVAINQELNFFVVDDDEDGPEFESGITLYAEKGGSPISPSVGLSDAQMREPDSWYFTVNGRDTVSGLGKGTGGIGQDADMSPWFSLFSPEGNQVVTPTVFANRADIDPEDPDYDGKDWFELESATMPAADYYSLSLNMHTVTVSAADYDFDRADALGVNKDMAFTINSNVAAFKVYDDDSVPPEIMELTIGGVGGTSSGEIAAGTLAVIGVNGNPGTLKERFSFIVLAPYPANTEFFFNDTGWDTNANTWYRQTEWHTNYYKFTEDVEPGDIFELELQDINSGGDQICIYQFEDDDVPGRTPSNYPAGCRFVYAINLDGVAPVGWDNTPLPDNNKVSTLYRGLTNGQNAISVPIGAGDNVNALYIGPKEGTATDLLSEICKDSNWETYPDGNLDILDFSFNITGSGGFDWNTPEMTDEMVFTGGYAVTNILKELGSGLIATNTLDGLEDVGSNPYFLLYNTNSEVMVSNNFTVTYANEAKGDFLTNVLASASPGIFEKITLGDVDVGIMVWDADNDRINDALSAALTEKVTVVDDDADPPAVAFTNIVGHGSSDYTGSNAEILFYDFGTDTENPLLQPSRTNISVQSVADVTVNNGTLAGVGSSTGNGAAISSTSWTNTIPAYWQFAITMQPGYSLDLTGFAFTHRRSSTGPTAWALRVSTDSYAADLASGTMTDDDSYHTVVVSPSSSLDSGTVTYRLYAWNAEANTGTWRIDNVYMTGTVATAAGYFFATDSDLNTNGVVFWGRVQDEISGVYGITDADYKPTWDLQSPVGVVDGLRSFRTGPADGGAKSPLVRLVETNGFDYADIVLGVYTAVVRAADFDKDRPDDALFATNESTLTVVDDDNLPPKFSVSGGGYLKFDGKAAGSEATAVTDGDLVNGLTITNNLYDVKSGVSNASVLFRVQSPDGWNSGLVDFTTRPGNGGAKAEAFNVEGTAVYIADYDVRLNDMENGILGRALGTWTSTFYAADFDDDRPGDQLATNMVVDMFVIDDDKTGPRMTNVTATGVANPALIATGFEPYDGWTSFGGGTWSHAANDGTWNSLGAYVQTTDGRGPEGIAAGYHVGFNDVDDSLELPPLDKPGWLTVWARTLGASDNSQWVLEQWSGTAWGIIETAKPVSGTEYQFYSWLVDSTNTNVRLRLRMTVDNGSIVFDDLVVTPYRDWTNTAITVQWAPTTDVPTGNSGMKEYRVVAPGTNAPNSNTNGVSIALSSYTNFTPVKEVQGVVTGYVFAVDEDEDRGQRDRAAGIAIPTIARFDIVPPTTITNLVADYSDGDPSTQFDLGWSITGVAPDDPNLNDLLPTGFTPGMLSPWRTYKVYFKPWDPQAVPENQTGVEYIMQNYITAKDWLVNPAWRSVCNTSVVVDTSANTNYLELAKIENPSIRLCDLDPGEDYVVVIVGVDKAGNESTPNEYSWATNDTIKFVVTSAWTVAKQDVATVFTNEMGQPVASLQNVPKSSNATALAWIAAGRKEDGTGAVTKPYDLIYWDSNTKFNENPDNPWMLAGTWKTNWYVDDGGMFKGRGNIRFYRASYKDRWRDVNPITQAPQRPLASEEVYALHNVVLSPGQNFVALHGVPWTNTFQAVFGGTNVFPGGELGISGTSIEFYSYGTNALMVESYSLNSQGQWWRLYVKPGDVFENVSTLEQLPGFFTRGFSIKLPNPLPPAYTNATAWDYNQLDPSGNPVVVTGMVWSPVLQVPTNDVEFSQTIYTGSNDGRKFTNVYNVCALRLPVAAHPSQMNLLDSGFVKGSRNTGDQIYTMDTSTKAMRSGSTIYCGTDDKWRLVNSDAEVVGGFFKPNDVIVIVSKNWVELPNQTPGTWTWTYDPATFYTLPNRWMGN